MSVDDDALNRGGDGTAGIGAESPFPPVASYRPRVWTVFSAVVVLLALIVLAQVVFVVAFIAWQATQHAGGVQSVMDNLLEELLQPSAFIVLNLLNQLCIGLVAIFAAWLSPRPLRGRIGWQRPTVSLAACVVIMVGALLPLAVGIAIAEWLTNFFPPDESVAMLYEQMTAAWAIPFILFIALGPGFMEEIFFRGYMQTRLLERWRPWVAILVTSIIFGLFHVTPHAMANAFVIGLWIGVIAWRTGSVWPGIACHAFINGMWNIWHVGHQVWGFPETPPPLLSVIGGMAIVACFCWSAWLLWRRPVQLPYHATPSIV